MYESCFADPRHQPTEKEIQLALGTCFPLWRRLRSFIEKHYQVQGTWSTWDPAKTGWNLRYRRKGKALAALHPQKERILVQLVLGKAQAARALQLELSKKISQILRKTPQLRDGRWLFIPVTSATEIIDIKKLLLTKMPPPKNAL
jgi:hypothetical protein